MARNWATNTDYIDVPTGANLHNSNTAFVLCWFKCSSSATFRRFYTEYNNFDNELFLRLNTAGKIDFIWRTPTNFTTAGPSASAYDDGAWHWVFLLRRATNDFEIYVDGTSILTDTVTVGTSSATFTVRIGNGVDVTTEGANGSIANLMTGVFAPSLAEATAMAYGVLDRQPDKLWASMMGDDIADWSGNSFALTNSGPTIDVNNPPMINITGLPVGSFLLTPVILKQSDFRWRNDDGSETTATWKAAQNTNSTIAVTTNVRLRMLIDATRDPVPKHYKLQYRKVGDTTWLDVN